MSSLGKLPFLFVFVSNQHRLDVKAQQIDKGFPKYTDMVFGGVPSDAHDVFQYKGKYFYKNML